MTRNACEDAVNAVEKKQARRGALTPAGPNRNPNDFLEC